MRSLRARLLLAVGLVVALSATAVGVVTHLGTRIEFDKFVEMETVREGPPAFDLDDIARSLQESRLDEAGWQDVAPLLHEMRDRVGAEDHLILLTPGGELLASTAPDVAPESVRRLEDGGLEFERAGVEGGERRRDVMRVQAPQREIRGADGVLAGTLHTVPPFPGRSDEPPGEGFLRSVDRWLWIAVVAGGLLALAATAAVAGRILGPVERLTRAAQRMASGDLTHRVGITSRDEVGELARTFDRMAESLERQEKQRRQMVTDVAHDLRTPLTNIRGQIEAIQDGLIQPSSEVFASLHEETMFLSALVSDLQDLSLVEAGKLRLEPRELQVDEEVNRVVQALRPGPAGARIVTTFPPLPAGNADPDRFRQVVRNLLTNALTHTPADGRIDVAAQEGAGEIEVTVRDTGPGIPSEHLAHVFERFYRADGSRDRRTGGAGLGLAIVKHLVTAQGGRVWAQSRPGEGACFGFTVPLAPARREVPAPPPPGAREG